jgi:3-oxoacyl-[acyl-carrier protein] reductase
MLNNYNALITGGDKGIGKAIALKFAENGANVYFTYNSNLEAAEATKVELEAKGVKSDFIQLNLKSEESISKAAQQIDEISDGINIIVNNAGYVDDVLFMQADLEKWNGVFQVIFHGTVSLTHKLLPKLITQDYARIINVASIAGLTGILGQTNYCAAKAAILNFTKTLGRELARLDVTVNAIAPGYIETDMTGDYDRDTKKAFKKSVPMNRFGKPEEIANVALFLASEMSSYITGQVIVADGGMI